MLISTECFSPLPLWDFVLITVLWRCWLGRGKGIRPVKKLSAWLSVWSELQTCMWPSWCHCHSLSLASVKSRLVLPFWYQLTRVVPEKGPLNGCVCIVRVYPVHLIHGDSAPGGHLTSVQTRQLAMSPPVGRLTWFTCYWHCPHSMWTKVCVMVRGPSICLSHVGVNLA